MVDKSFLLRISINYHLFFVKYFHEPINFACHPIHIGFFIFPLPLKFAIAITLIPHFHAQFDLAGCVLERKKVFPSFHCRLNLNYKTMTLIAFDENHFIECSKPNVSKHKFTFSQYLLCDRYEEWNRVKS